METVLRLRVQFLKLGIKEEDDGNDTEEAVGAMEFNLHEAPFVWSIILALRELLNLNQ